MGNKALLGIEAKEKSPANDAKGFVPPASRRLERNFRSQKTPARCRRYKKVEGRAVIGDGTPFDARRGSLGVQGRSQTAAASRL